MAKVQVIKVTRTPKNKDPKWVRNVYIDVSKSKKEKEEKARTKVQIKALTKILTKNEPIIFLSRRMGRIS